MLVQQGRVEAVMSAYNRVYGEPCGGSKYLLTDILRKSWGFNGHIVSDCDAINDFYGGHRYVKTPEEACAAAIKAGLKRGVWPYVQGHAGSSRPRAAR